MAGDGRRKTIRLGKVSQKQAESVRGHVENLVAATLTGAAPPDETSRWVAALPDLLRNRLAKAGLVSAAEPEPVPEPEPKLLLGAFLDGYMKAHIGVKDSTRIALGQAVRYLTEFFGADRSIDTITAGHADEWCKHLKGKLGLADNTVRRRSGAAKQLFKAAVRKCLLAENPFADLKSTVRGNPARQHKISRADAEKVLAACPDAEWRLIFALCRYGGLRCPSEVLGLTWDDIHWAEGRFTVHSPKTERHPGKESRVVPLFPELLPYLREAFEQAKVGTVYAITRYRLPNQNLSTKLRRILHNAGLTPWPKLYQNLRSTRQTELVDEGWPVHKVCAWLGNSPAVALKHYLQPPTDEDYQKAAQNPAQYVQEPGLPERESGTADVQRELSGQFRFPRAPKVLVQFRPERQARTPDDAPKLGAEVLVAAPVARDDVLGPRLGQFKDFPQVRKEFGKQRHLPRLAALVVFGLGAVHGEPPVGPIHVGPLQRQVLRRAPQAAESAQGENQPPLGIRAGVEHLPGLLARHEVITLAVALHQCLEVGKGVLGNQALPPGEVEELLGDPAPSPHGVLGQIQADEEQPPLVRVAGRDPVNGLVLAEEVQQVPPRVAPHSASARLGVCAPADVGAQPLA